MSTRYRLDDLCIDLDRQRVERDGIALDVGGLSFRLLRYLLLQGQRVVGFDELIAQVWAPALVNEETVTQRVRLLRQALGDGSAQPRYLRSVRGQGYQLCAPVHVEQVLPSPTRPARKRWLVAVSVVLVALLSAGAIYRYTSNASPSPSPLLQRADYYAGIGQRDNNERAIALYRQRLQEAPDDLQARLGLSRAYSAQVCQYDDDAALATQAQQLAEQVVATAPQLAAAHAALGYARDCQGRIGAALASYERALQLDPSADAVRGSAAYLYERQGRLAHALAENLAVRDPARVRFLPIQIASNLSLLGYASAAEARYRRSFQLYPDNGFSNLAWPRFLFEHGRMADAQAALHEAQGRNTDQAGLWLLQAELAQVQGDVVQARQASLRALQLRPQGSFAQTLAWALAAQSKPSQAILKTRARALLEGVDHGGDPFDALDAAVLFIGADAPEAALQALQRAVALGYRNAGYLRMSPLLAPLRPRPAFAALLLRIDADLAAQRTQVRRAGLLPEETGGATAAP